MPVTFRGDSLTQLRLFPDAARKRAGRQLELVQMGEESTDWKPLKTVGAGVRELRIRDESGVYRVIYLAKFEHRVFVLHCFQKKTQKTSGADIDLATQRYKELVREYSR